MMLRSESDMEQCRARFLLSAPNFHMNKTESVVKGERPPTPAPELQRKSMKVFWKQWQTRRYFGALAYGVVLLALFSPILIRLASYAADSELNSHIFLIPFVSAYLIYLKRRKLPRTFETSVGWATIPFAAATISLAVALGFAAGLSPNDYFTLMAFSLVSFVWTAGFLFFGRQWMFTAVFPMAFLIFFVPLPDGLADMFERGLLVPTALAADLFFDLSGTPHISNELVFQLPNIAIRVAQQCSGIRSSWVLFITGVLASYLFLQSPWRRIVFVALIIPLGVLRNGFRIFVIGLLCTEIGRHMIDSFIHHRGGPIFFVLSLIPLFFILWWMRSRERHLRVDADDATVPKFGT